MPSRESAFALERTRYSARVVVRRRLIADFVRWLGRLAVGAAIVALLLVLSGKAGWTALPDEWTLLGLSGAALLGAAGLAWRARWDEARAARELDRNLGSHDTLASALELRAAGGEHERPFVEELARRAETLASQARIDRIAPTVWGGSWLVLPLVVAVAAGLFTWLPERSEVARVQARKREQERRDAVSEIRAVAEAVAPKNQPADAAAPNKALEAQLAAIEEELKAGELTPHDARLKGAQALEEQAQKAERESRERQQSVEQAKRALARAAARSRDSAPGAERIASAIRQGDFDRAAQELDRLATDPAAAPAEKQRAAEELEKLASGLQEKAASNPDTATDSQSDQTIQQREKQLGESAKQAAEELKKSAEQSPQPFASNPPSNTPNPGPSAEKPRDSKPSPSSEQNSEAQKPQGEQNPGQPPSPSDKKDQPSRSSSPDPKTGNQKPDNNSQSQGQDQGSQPGSQPNGPTENKSADQPSKDQPGSKGPEQKQSPPEKKPRDQGTQPAPSENAPSSTPPGVGQPQRPELQPPSNAENQRPENSPTAQDQQKQPATQPSPGSSSQQPQTQPQQQPGRGNQDSQTSQSKQENPGPASSGQTQQKQSGSPQSSGTPQPSPGADRPQGDSSAHGNQIQRFANQLRSLSRDQSAAEQQRESARGMRDRAEQMLENASPEERAKLQDLARRLNNSDRPSSAPATPWRGPTQTFDARPDEATSPISSDKPSERTIAEWLSEPKPGGKGPGGVVPADSLKRASDSAQEAIEKQAIPPQHADLVRRVFKRYAEAAQAPAKPGSPK